MRRPPLATKAALIVAALTTMGLSAEQGPSPPVEVLPGTAPLMLEGDIASQLVEGVGRFLLREIAQSAQRRAGRWNLDRSSPESLVASAEPNRKRLAHILGVRDERVADERLEITTAVGESCETGSLELAAGWGFSVYPVRWPVMTSPAGGDVTGEGLLLEPVGGSRMADVIAIPDADQTPEMIAGLAEGIPAESQFARRLVERGCRVLVPVLIDRGVAHKQLSRREFLYRSAFELGRHIIGYEVQKILAAVGALRKDAAPVPLGVMGWGEGGLLALCAAGLDTRIQAACVSGYFEPRESVWQEPIYRNVFGLLEEFGDAEVASLIAPRPLIIEAARGPEVVVPPGTGGGPGRLRTPPLSDVRSEVERARRWIGAPQPSVRLIESGDGTGPFGTARALDALLEGLGLCLGEMDDPCGSHLVITGELTDVRTRQQRQFQEIDRHNQALLAESPYVRQQFFSKLDTGNLEKFQATVEGYREYFAQEVIGQFAHDLLPPAPRSRKVHDEAGYVGYEVVLDVFPDVIAFGILLVPKGIRQEERRPAVVCQHGLEGRPQDVADPRNDSPAYHRFACRLAERGFVTFAPQNLYIFGDRFRVLQRMANPLKKTLFSVIVPQHRQITRWLGSLDFVDPSRIAFYGLSYGGKTAMRVPPLVKEYCLSICSADFNDWVWKNASSRSPYSYVWTGEYEIFEFDLGSTFNYSEMAALIAPRPFMVERGHFDGVAPDEAVAHEFAKVRFLYAAKLGIAEGCRIEWFVGPHTINGMGTFDFLHEKLSWPGPAR